GTYYPNPVNSPTEGLSKSVEWYTQAFDLLPNEGNPQAIRVWITNYHDRRYSGSRQLWIDSISMVKYIGSINDTITLLENTPSKGLLSFYSSAQALPVTDTLMNNSTGGRTAILSVHREDPTSYSVILQLEGPTVLVLSQAFSDGWTARI